MNSDNDLVNNQKKKKQKVIDQNENTRHQGMASTSEFHRFIAQESMDSTGTPPGYPQGTNRKEKVARVDHGNNSYTDESKEPIVLHVENLDNKINQDEWQRILSDTLNKNRIEVSFFLFKNSSTIG